MQLPDRQADHPNTEAKKPALKKNFLMNALLSVSNVLFPLITFPYVSRILLPAGTGKVQFATSVIAYFSLFAQLGIPTYGIRLCARVRDDREELSRTVHELLRITLVMDVIAYLLLAAAVFCIPRLGEEKLLMAVVSCTILLNSIGMEWLYKGLEKYTYITLRSILFKTIALAAVFLLVRDRSDYILYGGLSIFAVSASNLLNFIHAWKYIDFRRPKGCLSRKHLKPVFVFFGMACAVTIYTHLDSVMLGMMATDADVGYYNAAIKVKTVLTGLITALGAVLLPRSSYYIERGRMEDFRKISEKALSFILLAAPPVVLYFMVFSRESILLLSGEAYLPAVLPMRILMPAVLLIGLTNLFGIQMLVPLGKEKVVLRSEIAGAVVDLVLNALLIPRFQAAGAAAGTLVAEGVVLIVQYSELRSSLSPILRRFSWGRLFLGLLLASAAGLWIITLDLKPFFALLASGALFFGAYGLYVAIFRASWYNNESA